MLYLDKLRDCKLKLSAGGQKIIKKHYRSLITHVNEKSNSEHVVIFNDNSLHEKNKLKTTPWIKFCRKKSFKWSICEGSFVTQQRLNDRISSGHEKKKHLQMQHLRQELYIKTKFESSYFQFMRIKSLSNAAFVMVVLHQNKVCIIIFHQSMKIKSPSNAAFVMTALHQKF